MIDGRMINTTDIKVGDTINVTVLSIGSIESCLVKEVDLLSIKVEKNGKDRFIYKDQIINIFKEKKNERDWQKNAS